MKDLIQLKSKIKEALTRENTATIVSFLGYKIDRSYRFVDDKSMCITPDGKIKNFGNSGFSYGDIFDWLQFSKGITLKESIFYVADLMGIEK